MTTKPSSLVPLQIEAGVLPVTDATPVTSKQWVDSQAVRMWNGRPQKIGGRTVSTFLSGQSISGTTRMVFSAELAGRAWTLIGTNEKLYSLIGSNLYNITPLQNATIAIPNSMATHYDTLINNPFSTVDTTNVITVSDTEASLFKIGDTVTFSGATGFAGISAGTLNSTHVIRNIGVNTYSFRIATNANATTSGGGAAVNRTSGLLTVTDAAHGQGDGDRIKITGSTDVGGLLAAAINLEHIIRNVTPNTFDVMIAGFSTSSVTSGGGAGTEYQQEIPEGALNESFGQGYGMGLYGAGLYGVSKISSQLRAYPRLWSATRFGDVAVVSPGNGGGIYIWTPNNAVAPELLTNTTPAAPENCYYLFESNQILVSFGENNVLNRVTGSDQNDFNNYTGSSTNQVFRDDLEGAGRLLSHVNVNGVNLLLTEQNCYGFTYIGLPNVWEIYMKDPNIGIISQNARCNAGGRAYWMGPRNFYSWDGGDINIMGANTRDQSTLLNYVYSNINWGQKSKCFGWYNQQFNEIWFHYPSANSNECDRVARFNVREQTWVPDVMNMTAAEYPISLYQQPRIANVGVLYKQESGADAAGQPMPWFVRSNKRTISKDSILNVGFVPDSLQSGNITVTVNGYDFPQSVTPRYSKSFVVTPSTDRITAQINGRFWDYTISGNDLGQTFSMGQWYEYLQEGPTN